MPPTDGNPLGYFESQRIFENHEELLAEAGSAWDDFSAFPREWFGSPAADVWVERMARTVEEEYGDSPLIVIKDPRICRLVPFWEAVLDRVGIEPSYVISIRNPLEVVRSLEKSQKTDEATGALIWLQHQLAAERDTRRSKRSIVSYEELLRDWRRTLRKVGGDLELKFSRRTALAEAEVDQFLTERMRHQRVAEEDLLLSENVAGWVKDVFQWANRSVAGQSPSTRVLTNVRRELETADAVYAPLVAKTRLALAYNKTRASDLDDEVSALRTDVAAAGDQVETLCSELESAQSQVAASEQQVAHLSTDLGSRDRELDKLIDTIKFVLQWAAAVSHGSNAVAALEPLYDAIDSGNLTAIPQIANAGLQLAQVSAEAARFEEEIESLGGDLQRANAELRQRDTELAAKEAELAQHAAKLAQRATELAERGTELAERDTELAERGAELAERGRECERLSHLIEEHTRELDRRTSELQALKDSVDQHTAEGQRLERELLDARRALGEAGEESERLSGLEAQRSREITELESQIEGVGAALEQRRADQQQLEARATATDAERDKLTALLKAERHTAERRKKEVFGLGEKAAARDAKIARLTAELADVRAKSRNDNADRDFLIRSLRDRVHAVENSLSWRATRPAREVARTLRRGESSDLEPGDC